MGLKTKLSESPKMSSFICLITVKKKDFSTTTCIHITYYSYEVKLLCQHDGVSETHVVICVELLATLWAKLIYHLSHIIEYLFYHMAKSQYIMTISFPLNI